MSHGWYYKEGSWNVVCDVCARSIKSSDARKRWDGLIVCDDDYETRHPQDFIRIKPERHGVPFSRPEPADVFVVNIWVDVSRTVNNNDYNSVELN